MSRVQDGVSVAGWVSAVTLGRTLYEDALALQRRLHAQRATGEVADHLLLTEHEPVLTLGRRADDRYLRVTHQALAARGIGLVRTERGGDITHHGPGQLVAYPILDLRPRGCDVHRYVRELEETAMRFLARFGLAGERRPGRPGVWAGGGKIASVGVYVSRWTTMHGIAINLAPEPAELGLIYPCGLTDTYLTSVALLTGAAPPMDAAWRDFSRDFAVVFDVQVREADLPRTASALVRAPSAASGPEHE